MDKYEQYMQDTFSQDPNEQWLKCVDWCKQMQKEFPELRLVKGCVYSHQNLDNISSRYPKQYPHAWLETAEGKKIDPTVLQFSLLGKLIYDEWETPPETRPCNGCGQYHWKKGSIVCGECEWSDD